jgi:hypothetical protein
MGRHASEAGGGAKTNLSMKTKHTPGPWRHNGKRNAIESTTEMVYEDQPVQVISTFAAMGGENTDADILLIAAAPDLLEALEEAKKLLEAVRVYLPKSMHDSNRFAFENTLANVIMPAIKKATQISNF